MGALSGVQLRGLGFEAKPHLRLLIVLPAPTSNHVALSDP